MLRAGHILRAGTWDADTAIDRVTLDHDARHRRRFAYVGEGGTAFLLDLPAATVLGDGDGLRLDDGRVVAVAAAGEPLIEVRAATPALLMRLAWHIGNRHLPADIGTDRIRLRADHVIAAMLRGLGGAVAEIVAPFAPEAGAYAGGHGARDHGRIILTGMRMATPVTRTITCRADRTATIMSMTTDRALGLLLAWTSPSYPVGAFSYSHGLEAAVEDGDVRDAATLVDYVTAVISRGGGWVDAVLFARAYAAWGEGRADPDHTGDADHADCPDLPYSRHSRKSGNLPGAGAHVRFSATSGDPRFRGDGGMGVDSGVDGASRESRFDAIAELAVAFRGSSETALESRQMGRSFLSVTRAAWPHPALDAFADRHAGRPVAHAITGALACAVHGVPLAPALAAWLHGTAANLVSAGVRLVPLGQTDGQIATARLLPVIADVVARALATDLDDLGTSAPLVELASLAHETQYTRLFRS